MDENTNESTNITETDPIQSDSTSKEASATDTASADIITPDKEAENQASTDDFSSNQASSDSVTGTFSMPTDPASTEEIHTTASSEINSSQTETVTESTAPVTEPIASYNSSNEYTSVAHRDTSFSESTNDSYPNSGSYSAGPTNADTYNPYSNTAAPINNSIGTTSTGLAIASLVLGIVGILFACCCPYLGIILSIIGVILGCVQEKDPITGQKPGYAIAGIICSAAGIVLGIVVVILSFLLIRS